VKPANYGSVIQKDHPVTEYLDDKQLKMLRERTGPDTPENTFDNKWSGFKDKSVLAEGKRLRGQKKRRVRINRTKGSADGDVGEYIPDNNSKENDRRKLYTVSSSTSSITSVEESTQQFSAGYLFLCAALLAVTFILNGIFIYRSFYPQTEQIIKGQKA